MINMSYALKWSMAGIRHQAINSHMTSCSNKHAQQLQVKKAATVVSAA